MSLLLCTWIYAQDRQITGTVTDDTGTALPGVSVVVKGTAKGMITDNNGLYRLNLPEDMVLIFSYIGFSTQEIAVGNRSVIDVVMLEDVKMISEVVVVGYGSQKKSQLTGAISSIKSKDIEDLVITNTQQALQGRIAGVDVTQQGSKPGASPRVIIRGRRSFNASNDPLYVLDGIPLATGIKDINPSDIASMEILKDASATAIYGARGANGVVLITTRRGGPGKTMVYYDGYYGFSNIHRRIDMMNGGEFAEMKREAYRASGKYTTDEALFEAVELKSIQLGRSTDYVAALLHRGKIINQQVGIAGGNDKTSIYMSLNYFKDWGVVYNTDYNRNVLRFNMDHKINDYIKIGTSSFVNYTVHNGEGFSPLNGAMQENPLGNPYNDDGSLNFFPTTDGLRSNPMAEIVPEAILNQKKTNRFFVGLFAEADIATGLRYRLNFSPDFQIDKLDNFMGSRTNQRRLGPPSAAVNNDKSLNYTLENIVTYDKSLGVHQFNLTGVQSIQQYRAEGSAVSVEGVPAESQLSYSLSDASTVQSVNSYLSEWAIASFMGRLNYSFADKYLITGTLRADGSSRFGANSKWGYFPGVSLAWNVSAEPFMNNSRVISNLKLRVSYGSIGNQAINPYQTQGQLNRTSYNWGNTSAFGYQPASIGNPNLRWETSTTANFGLDFDMLGGRIAGTLEYYIVNTRDLLLSRQLPTSTGFGTVTTNVGHTRNSGFEATINTVNVTSSGGFKWTTDFTVFTNKEEIVELYNGKNDDLGNAWFIGKPLSVFYDYKKIGIWQTGEEDLAKSYGYRPGEIKVDDYTKDGKIDTDDRMILGSGVPKLSGGITNRFSYKGFDLSFFAYIRWGQTIRSQFHNTHNRLFGRYNNLDVDYWTPDNPTNEFPRPNQNQESPRHNSSVTLFDGSFIKVRNINFGYKFPSEVCKKAGMESLRLYTSIQQPFIFAGFISKYKGVDPETDISEGLGTDSPSTYTVTFGISATF